MALVDLLQDLPGECMRVGQGLRVNVILCIRHLMPVTALIPRPTTNHTNKVPTSAEVKTNAQDR
jgi:hypothetical protein